MAPQAQGVTPLWNRLGLKNPAVFFLALATFLIGVSVYQELTSNRIACGDLDAARQWMWDRAGVIDDASAAEQCEFYAKGKAVYQAMKLCVPDFKYDPNVEARITQTVQAKKAQCP